MTPIPLVSVVLCTYNGKKHLQEQLHSLLKQEYSPLEFIIVDDVSTDGTFDLLQTFAQQDSRIRLSRNVTNLGYNQNFQQAIAKASGQFVAIADQDDIWELSKIRIMMQQFDKDEHAVMVHCRSTTFRTGADPDRKSIRKLRCFEGNDPRKLFLYNQISGHNMIVKKSLIEKAFPFPSQVYYDWWLAVVACCYGNIRCIDRVLVYHRLHEHNVTVVEVQKPFYSQVLSILPVFLEIPAMKEEHKSFGEVLLHRFSELEKKKFSFSLFTFIWRHARIIFSFRRYAFPYPSYFKRAMRLASAGYVSKP